MNAEPSARVPANSSSSLRVMVESVNAIPLSENSPPINSTLLSIAALKRGSKFPPLIATTLPDSASKFSAMFPPLIVTTLLPDLASKVFSDVPAANS